MKAVTYSVKDDNSVNFFRHKNCEFVITLLKSIIPLSMYEAIFLDCYLQVFRFLVYLFFLFVLLVGFFFKLQLTIPLSTKSCSICSAFGW